MRSFFKDGYSIVLCDPSSDINVDTNWTAAISSVIPSCVKNAKIPNSENNHLFPFTHKK